VTWLGLENSAFAAKWMPPVEFAPIAPAPVQQTDEFLTVKAAAQRLGCSADSLYKNSASLPFTRHLGKKLLFSTRGIEEYLRQGKP
jgi:predicted DNA-binding transcriptional regulator AlpA